MTKSSTYGNDVPKSLSLKPQLDISNKTRIVAVKNGIFPLRLAVRMIFFSIKQIH